MLQETEIKKLLKKELEAYVKNLKNDNLHFCENGAAALAYLKILGKDNKFLSLTTAEKLLEEL